MLDVTDCVLTDAVDARSEDGTLVDVFRTITTGESWRAGAGVVPDAVDTRAAILARIGRRAIIDVLLAEVAGESYWASAFVAVDQIETLFAVDARHRETFVDVALAVNALETCQSKIFVNFSFFSILLQIMIT